MDIKCFRKQWSGYGPKWDSNSKSAYSIIKCWPDKGIQSGKKFYGERVCHVMAMATAQQEIYNNNHKNERKKNVYNILLYVHEESETKRQALEEDEHGEKNVSV